VLGWALLWLLHRWRLPYRYGWLFGLLGWLLLFALGFQLTVCTDSRAAARVFLCSSEGEPLLYRAEVLEPLEASASGKTYRAKVRLSARLGADGMAVHGHALAMLWVSPDTARPLPVPGDRLWVRTALAVPQGPQNPGGFDYGRYLSLQHIHLRGYVRADGWLYEGHRPPPALRALAWRLRERFARALHAHVPAPREEAVAAALIFGEKSAISDELERAYADTGAMHLLAVSGMHVGLLAAMLAALLKPLQRWRRYGGWLQAVLMLVVVGLFALVTGLSGSVLRAAAMFALLQAGGLLRREAEPFNLLAGSAFVLLAFEPRVLADVGAQLSYAAVAGILLFYRPLVACWAPRWRIVWAAWQLTAVSLAAQLGTLPLALWYFHQFPTYFLLSGWVGVPLSTVALPVGLALFCLAEVPYVADALGWALYACVWPMNECMALLARLPGAALPASVGLGELVVGYGAVGALGVWAGWRSRKWLWLAMGCLLVTMGLRAARLLPLGRQRIQVVFALREGHAALFVQGHRAVCRLDSTARRNLDFQQCLRAFRAERGIWTIQEVDWHDTAEYLGPGYWSWGPFVQASGQRWGFFAAENASLALAPPLDRWVLYGPGNPAPPDTCSAAAVCWMPSFSRKALRPWQRALPDGWDAKARGAWVHEGE
jgi:competence protein ComEC